MGLKIETSFCVMWHSGNPLASLPHVQINEMVICPFPVAFSWLLTRSFVSQLASLVSLFVTGLDLGGVKVLPAFDFLCLRF